MRNSRLAAMAIAVVAGAAALTGGVVAANAEAPQAETAVDREADQEAFDEIRRQQERAWIDQDGAAFAATFHEESDVVAVTGHHLSGREGIAEGMQYFFDNYIVPSSLHMMSEEVRYVERDVVVIVRTGCIINKGETECREGSLSTNTNVLTREHGEWLQTSFQNTRQIELE